MLSRKDMLQYAEMPEGLGDNVTAVKAGNVCN
jgi:homoserine kinase